MDILKQAEQYISSLYTFDDKHNLVYHNIGHTRKVVGHVNEIAAHYELSEKEIIMLNIAAWFHDVGHLYQSPASHEEKSVELMKKWIENKEGYAELGDEIERIILATKMAVEPTDIPQQIIKDADTYHFGTKEFKKFDNQMRKEMKLRNMGTILMDWKKNTLALLEQHRFYTDYCKNLLEKRKQKNISKVREKVTGAQSYNISETLIPGENKENDSKKDTNKPDSFITKGIQTMLRLTSENHIRLSDMADNKANILISVNAIIISVILSVLMRKIEVDRHLAIPTMIFLTSSVVTIVLAILSTRPIITTGNFTREQVLNRQTNLLFFGNFHKVSLEEYKWAMGTMMRDSNYLYGVLVDDIYYLGHVLGRKYKLVRVAYNVFMIGIIISVVSFTLAILFNSPTQAPTVVEGTGSPF